MTSVVLGCWPGEYPDVLCSLGCSLPWEISTKIISQPPKLRNLVLAQRWRLLLSSRDRSRDESKLKGNLLAYAEKLPSLEMENPCPHVISALFSYSPATWRVKPFSKSGL